MSTNSEWVYNWASNRWLMKETNTVIHDEDMPEELKPDTEPLRPLAGLAAALGSFANITGLTIEKTLKTQEAALNLMRINRCAQETALNIANTLGPDATNAIATRIAETGLTLTDITKTLGEPK